MILGKTAVSWSAKSPVLPSCNPTILPASSSILEILLSFFEFLDYDYLGQYDFKKCFNYSSSIFEYDVDDYVFDYNNKYDFIIDETLEDTFKVEISYYKDILDIKEVFVNKKGKKYILYNTIYDEDDYFLIFKKCFKSNMNSLKEKKIYNYNIDNLNDLKIKVFISSENANKFKIN